MRVEIKTQKGVPVLSHTEDTRVNTVYEVILVGRGSNIVVDSFSTPGSFTDGYLSEHQAKVRARERVEGLKAWLAEQNQLDIEPEVTQEVRKPRTPKLARIADEQRSFAPRRA